MRKPEFVYVTYIETTPEKLWEALTSSEFSWPAILSSLKSLLESGTALAIPPSALAIEGFDGP